MWMKANYTPQWCERTAFAIDQSKAIFRSDKVLVALWLELRDRSDAAGSNLHISGFLSILALRVCEMYQSEYISWVSQVPTIALESTSAHSFHSQLWRDHRPHTSEWWFSPFTRPWFRRLSQPNATQRVINYSRFCLFRFCPLIVYLPFHAVTLQLASGKKLSILLWLFPFARALTPWVHRMWGKTAKHIKSQMSRALSE